MPIANFLTSENIDSVVLMHHKLKNLRRASIQEALLSQRGRAMLRVCLASIQNVESSLLLLVVSASDIPLRTIKFFSVLFSSAYSSMLQAVTNKHSLVSRVRSTLHGRR